MTDDPKDLTEALFQNSLYVGLNGEAKAPEPHPKYSKGYIDPETGAWRPFKLKRQVRTRHPSAMGIHMLAAMRMVDYPYDLDISPTGRIRTRDTTWATDRIRQDIIRLLENQPRRRALWPALAPPDYRREIPLIPPQSTASDIAARSTEDLADAAAYCMHAMYNHDTISVDVETSKLRFDDDAQRFVIGVDFALEDKDHPQNEVPGAD